MSISMKTRKTLWGRSGGMCAICRELLFEDEGEADDPSVLGEECHIVAREKDGPRGDSPLTEAQRDQFANLILLCLNHHKIIDDQPEKYTVVELHRIKNEHLLWVKQTLGLDEARQADEEMYVGFAETWARLAHLNEWDDVTYGIMSGDAPVLRKQVSEDFDQLHDWLFSRVYPERYPPLNDAFENFRLVLHDFRGAFSEHFDPDWGTGNLFRVRKFYKIDLHDPELYNRLREEFQDYVWLLEDFALEMTRAGNYLCDKVRSHVMRSYRLREGMLIARGGIWIDGKERSFRTQYRGDERTARPYPGLEQFKNAVRFQRDFCFGGQPESGPEVHEGE